MHCRSYSLCWCGFHARLFVVDSHVTSHHYMEVSMPVMLLNWLTCYYLHLVYYRTRCFCFFEAINDHFSFMLSNWFFGDGCRLGEFDQFLHFLTCFRTVIRHSLFGNHNSRSSCPWNCCQGRSLAIGCRGLLDRFVYFGYYFQNNCLTTLGLYFHGWYRRSIQFFMQQLRLDFAKIWRRISLSSFWNCSCRLREACACWLVHIQTCFCFSSLLRWYSRAGSCKSFLT